MMTKKFDEWLEVMLDVHGDMLRMDGYDRCIVGVFVRAGQEAVIVYDRAKVIKQLMKEGMDEEEAPEMLRAFLTYYEELHEFNQAGAWMGERTPGFLVVPD